MTNIAHDGENAVVAGYCPNYYTDTLHPVLVRPAAQGRLTTETLVIGGGLAGLATAISLVEAGRHDVIVIEAGRIAAEASGRNCGQVLPGFSRGEHALIADGGLAAAQALFGGTLRAQTLISERVRRYGLDCGVMISGYVQLAWWDRPEELAAQCKFYNDNFGTDYMVWDRATTRAAYVSDKFHGAIFSAASGLQLHALNYAQGLAAAIERAGGKAYENTAAIAVQPLHGGWQVTTPQAVIQARQVVIAGGTGIVAQVSRPLARGVLAMHSFMGVTEPLSAARVAALIRVPYCAYDTRNIMSYFRSVPDGAGMARLLFGCGARMAAPLDCSALVRQEMLRIFPQMQDVRLQHVWSGQIGYGKDYMPLIGRLAPGLYYNSGHGGHGLATTTFGGEAVAASIGGDDTLLRLFAPYQPRWVNHAIGRRIVAPLLLGWMGWKDRRRHGSNIATGAT
jgi:gamma-glutamylputrescine oxidase